MDKDFQFHILNPPPSHIQAKVKRARARQENEGLAAPVSVRFFRMPKDILYLNIKYLLAFGNLNRKYIYGSSAAPRATPRMDNTCSYRRQAVITI